MKLEQSERVIQTLERELAASRAECLRLKALLTTGVAVVEDFMPNIGRCVLTDYGRLNDFLIQSSKALKGDTPC